LARLAVELGHDDAVALARCGHTLAHLVGDVDSGVRLVDGALSLNLNLALAWWSSGWLRAFRGQSDAAIERFAHARLSPLDPELFRMRAGTGFAHLLAGRFNEASSWAEKAAGDLPNYLSAVSVMAAANALAGRTAEARRAMLHVRQLDPLLRLSNLQNLYPIRRPEDFAVWSDGLRKAGLPE